ncbi:MAG: hypothetical protein JJE55_12405 [Flavobacteriaceae bacterium]|nr:hypothetical protein [Flavobacteriaceae bacterium]
MEQFKWAILILPVISLIGVVLMYLYFRNKVKNEFTYKYFISTFALTAFLFNIGWELLQGPLYEGYQYDWNHIRMCLLASVTDMLTLLVMLFGLGLFYKNIFWIQKLSVGKIILIVVSGGTGTILLERLHIAIGYWEYAKAMPILPIVDVGLTPFLQFTVLPIAIFIVGEIIYRKSISSPKF